MEKIPYRIKHLAINNPDAQTAQALIQDLHTVFDLDITVENDAAAMVGSIFEIMKHNRRGTVGHIALETPDVELAMNELAKKGIGFLMETARYDENGKCIFVFLDREFGGYAIHLTT